MSIAEPDVVVVGAGPSGLAAALELRRRSVDVLVLDREAEAGGIPRHSSHQGFGLRDLHRVTTGPRYARLYADGARAAGARIVTEAMVTGWSVDGALEVTGPSGRDLISPSAVVLATGCRERPRSARLVPGSRPDGVMTTGMLQQLVYLYGRRPGSRALIVGAEHVSFSAILALRHGGADVAGMVTELPHHQSFALFRLGARFRYRVPLWSRTAVTAINGSPRVEEVELTDLISGRSRQVRCDTVVFTADWIPDHELAVMADVDLDPGTRGPAVDAGLRTSRPAVFAAGNLLHGAETADIAALSGRHAAAAVVRYIVDRAWPDHRTPIVCHPPLRWTMPNVISSGAGLPPRGRFALRSDEFLRAPTIRIIQDGEELLSTRLVRMIPGRSSRLSSRWMTSANPEGGPIHVTARDRS